MSGKRSLKRLTSVNVNAFNVVLHFPCEYFSCIALRPVLFIQKPRSALGLNRF